MKVTQILCTMAEPSKKWYQHNKPTLQCPSAWWFLLSVTTRSLPPILNISSQWISITLTFWATAAHPPKCCVLSDFHHEEWNKIITLKNEPRCPLRMPVSAGLVRYLCCDWLSCLCCLKQWPWQLPAKPNPPVIFHVHVLMEKSPQKISGMFLMDAGELPQLCDIRDTPHSKPLPHWPT